MIKRILFRLFLVGAACFVLLVTCVSATAYLVFSSPSFYAEELARPIAAGEADKVEQRLEQMREDFLRWRATSLAVQRAQQGKNPDQAAGNAENKQVGFKGADDVFTIRLTQDEMNALLASDATKLPGGQLSDLRVHVEDDQLLLAFTLKTPVGDLALSTGFSPRLMEEPGLNLQVNSASVGRLPLPITTVSRYLPKQKERLSGDLFLDTTGSLPVLTLKPRGKANEVARAKTIRCLEGEVIVEVMAPELAQK